MDKNTKNISGIQDDFFQQLEAPAESLHYSDLDITHELRGAVSQALKIALRQGMTRPRLADELNALLPYIPTKITLRKINSWMASAKEDHPFPAYVIPAICIATNCTLPLQVMAKSINLELSDRRDLVAQQLGEIDIQTAALVRKKRQLKSNY